MERRGERRREEIGQGEEEEKGERRHGSEERNKGEKRDRGEEGRDDQSLYCFCHLFLVTLHELVSASHILPVCSRKSRKKSREGCLMYTHAIYK